MSKRVAFTLDDYTYNLISRISEDLDKTKSKVVIELFHLMGPALSHISVCKRMIDEGLKTSGEESFRAFLSGLKKDFDSSMDEAETAFFTDLSGGGDEEPEDMQDDERDGTEQRLLS